MTPTITAAICTYNRAHYLRPLIQSLLQQTCTPDCIMVVDDCSTDNTKELIYSEFPQVRFFSLNKHRYLSAVRNLALRKCTTDIILYVDSDTITPPQLVETVLKTYSSYNCHAAGGQGIETNIVSIFDRFRKNFLSQSFGAHTIKNPSMLMGIVMSYKTEFLRKIGGFSPVFKNYGEDAECGMRMKKSGKLCVYNPDIRVFHQRTDTFFSLLCITYRYAYWQSRALSLHGNNNSKTVFQALKYFFIIIWQSVWYYKSISQALIGCAAGLVKIAAHIAGGIHEKEHKCCHIKS